MEHTLPKAAELRRMIRENLPEKAFKNVPSKALLFIPLGTIVVTTIWFIHSHELVWYWLLAISVILGQVYATSAFLAHEVSHGSVVKSKNLADFIAYFGLYPFLVSPHLWRIWHVQAHHGKTNTTRDPDTIVNLEEYLATPLARLWTRFVPCSRRRIVGMLFFLYWFTLHGQNILWFHRRYRHWGFEIYAFNRYRAIADTLVYVLLWIFVWYLLGWYKGIFVVAIPMMIGNAILLSFIATEHTCLPRSQVGDNHPLKNSVSAKVPAVIDWLNLNFSNHVEHHFFPTMNYKYTPLVRKWLRQNMQEYYLEPSLSRCISVLFNSPRIYCDDEHLCYPDDVDGSKVATDRLRALLANA